MRTHRHILLFDVMNTLVYDPFYVEVPAFFGLTLAELHALKHPTAWLEFEVNAIDERAFLPRFFGRRLSWLQTSSLFSLPWK